MRRDNIVYHDTDLWHEQGEIVSQEQAAIARRRIEELKRKNTSVYIGQPEAKQSDDECYNEISEACKRFINEPIDKTEQELAKTLEKHNLRLYCYPAKDVPKFTKAQASIARCAFDGVLPPPACLYPSKDIVIGFPENRGLVKPEDYDFNRSLWEVFKKIPEFAVYESKIRESLAKRGIKPEKLPEMKLHDFYYLLEEHLPKPPKDTMSVSFMRGSYKARNTKRFIEENEEEFRAGLLSMPGVKKEYVKMLIRAMKEGKTDLTQYKIDGKSVWKEEWANQPVINVHHIVNVKDSHNIDDWTKVNDYENMCFIVTYPQHEAMHALEQDLQGNYHNDVFGNKKVGKDMYYRIQPPEGVRCMLGFHNMIYDRKFLSLPEKEKAEIKQRAENDNNRVSGSHGRNSWRGHPDKDPYTQRKDWKQERLDYVRR